VQEFTTLFVGKDTTEEVQQHIAKTCRANSKLFATSGKHHLVVCLPDQGIRFYHDGTSSCAIESLLKLTDSPLRKIYYEGDSPFVKDILANKLTTREVPLQAAIVIDQIAYQQHQFTKDIRRIFSNIVREVRKSAQGRINCVLSRNFLQLEGLEAGTIIFSFGQIQQAEIAKCYQQLQYIAQLKTESIRTAKKNLEELQVQDQIEGKYVGYFEEISDIFDRKDSKFEVCTDTTREALLALAV
jgi:hypothetical protein